MAPLRVAALSFGTLALLQGNSVSEARTVAKVTDDVITWFNLMRNGKIDFELQSLIPISDFEATTAGNTILDSSSCEPNEADETWKKALHLKLDPPVDGTKYGPNLDTLINNYLQTLMDAKGKAAKETANLVHIVNPKAAQVGCGLASVCGDDDDFKRLFCQFKTSDGQEIDIETETIPIDFLNAMKARKDAHVTISSMTADDLSTRLTSGVSKAAVSALAALALALPTLLF